MLGMKKKKPPQNDPPERDGVNFNFWLENEVADAMAAYSEAAEIKPSKTGFFRAAAIEFLAKRGYWPPKPKTN